MKYIIQKMLLYIPLIYPKYLKILKKMKITKNIHIYSNPYGEKTIENMYQDIVSTKFSV